MNLTPCADTSPGTLLRSSSTPYSAALAAIRPGSGSPRVVRSVTSSKNLSIYRAAVFSYGWRFTVAATSVAASFQLTAPIASMIASQSQLIHALTILPSATWYQALAVACHFLPLGG